MLKWIQSLFSAKPLPVFHHGELGVLTLDSGLWSGTVRRAGREIAVHIAGTEMAPDNGLLVHASNVLARFTQVESEAVAFIRDQEAGLSPTDLTIYSLDFLWEAKPDDFVLEFTLQGDLDGVWRVEFEAGCPKSLGRDD